MTSLIRVLVVDDHLVVRKGIRALLATEPEIEVVGEARDGVEATGLVASLRPSLVTMDLQMPRMGGLDAIDWVMKNQPTPILVVTDKPRLDGVDMTFASLSRGAMDLIPKAQSWRPGSPEQQALYRIAQEALNNALKHAHAQRITVQLRQVQTRVVLEIIDDGVGFDPAAARENGGLGLRGIAERVAQLGGTLTLQSAAGAGTQLSVEIAL